MVSEIRYRKDFKVYCKKDCLVYETDYKKGSVYTAYYEDESHIWVKRGYMYGGCRFYILKKGTNGFIYGTQSDFDEHFYSVVETRKEKLKKIENAK